MTQRTGLGRGLAALLPDPDAIPSKSVKGVLGPFREVPVAQIQSNPRQPREIFDEESLAVLANSISYVGVLQPLLVRTSLEGYELVAGERRLRAAKRAGLTIVPVYVRDVSDRDSLEQALFENVHRKDLNPLEEAAAFRQLIDDFGMTHEDVANRVGKSRAAVTNTLRLLALPGDVQKLLMSQDLSSGHARALLPLADGKAQIALALRIVAEGWTVRAAEEAVKKLLETSQASVRPKQKPLSHPALLEVGELMGDYLGTKVDVKMGKGIGRMVIEFGSLHDLERISDLILKEKPAQQIPDLP